MGLTFDQLREANRARLPQFRNNKGELAHNTPTGSDWSPAQWLQAVVGELGEYANKRKKFERGDITFEEFKAEAADELADVVTYLDILAQRCLDHDIPTPGEGNLAMHIVHKTGIDLGAATIQKFNKISKRAGSNVTLGPQPDAASPEQPSDAVSTASRALLGVAFRRCGSPNDLTAGNDPVLIEVLTALVRLGLVERHRHLEAHSGRQTEDYMVLRFTEQARDIIKAAFL